MMRADEKGASRAACWQRTSRSCMRFSVRNGLTAYLHAWLSFIQETHAAPCVETVVAIDAVAFWMITGLDRQQVAIAARRPRDAWLGWLLASLFLTVTAFLPAATAVAAFHVGKLFGLRDAASTIPWIVLQTSGSIGLVYWRHPARCTQRKGCDRASDVIGT
ncbi:hypothetical protein VSR69_40845 [Paraburkholderia phytofirmans]